MLQPDCQIDVLAPAWSFSLLERMPEVAKAIAMPLSHGQFGLAGQNQAGQTITRRALRSGDRLAEFLEIRANPLFCRYSLRTGFIGECRWGLLNDARKLDKASLTMTVQRFVALALPDTADCCPSIPYRASSSARLSKMP